MKVRDSGMPEEANWNDFFNVDFLLSELNIDSQITDLVEIGSGYGTFTIPAARLIQGKLYAFDIEDEMIDILYDIIRDLNPSLHIFDESVKNNIKNPLSKKYHILLGMGSLFNLDDIKEFIEGSVGYLKMKDPDYSMKHKFIEKKLKTYIQFVPSFNTMDIIYKHVLNI